MYGMPSSGRRVGLSKIMGVRREVRGHLLLILILILRIFYYSQFLTMSGYDFSAQDGQEHSEGPHEVTGSLDKSKHYRPV